MLRAGLLLGGVASLRSGWSSERARLPFRGSFTSREGRQPSFTRVSRTPSPPLPQISAAAHPSRSCITATSPTGGKPTRLVAPLTLQVAALTPQCARKPHGWQPGRTASTATKRVNSPPSGPTAPLIGPCCHTPRCRTATPGTGLIVCLTPELPLLPSRGPTPWTGCYDARQ